MKRGSPALATRIFSAFLVARAAYGLAYLGVALGRFPVPWYLPLERRWEITSTPSGFGMGWFGATLIASIAALSLGALTYALSARGPLARALSRTGVVLSIARAGALVLLVDFVYFGWTLTHQTPHPL